MFATLQQAQEVLSVGAFDHVTGHVRLWFAGLNQVAPFGDVGTDSPFGDGDNYDSAGIGENTADSSIYPYN
eukprot:CAMPEP_0172167092 /NCGR_PEP_ID=MMETSP1050-20130122/9373_1 /TAXON_ID=233186 /ORGANISM="Cryptomonas curvata, Strain CCAP979/52" /LENGTH=70 /DNA_ID=CAMNT_0012837831 /DNA_START=21 /DNA_END=233 /DNA_ORIENTATION=-